MGILLSLAMNKLFPAKNTRVLMVGLDAAGKTTMLYKMKLNENIHTAPTIGFNVEQLEFKNLKMVIWDIGGQDFLRKLWHHYYEKNDGIIFVVDTSDEERLKIVANTIEEMTSDERLADLPLIVFGNKQDLTSLTSTEIIEKIGLLKLKHKNWYFQPSCAITGEGLYEGFNWLSKAVSVKK